MNAENLFATFHIGNAHTDLAVKTPRTEKCWIKNIGAVGCRNNDNTGIFCKAVHFHQQLIQSLFPFIMATANTCAALTSHSVNFINKYNARSIFLRLIKEIANARRSNPHKHFHKVRTADGEKRDTGFSSHGFGQ